MKKDVYPLPCIDDLLDKLSKSCFLSAIDLASGYHQVKLADDACEKTAFVTRYGLFEYTILPLGLCNALSMFQCLMNAVMSGYTYDFILVYLTLVTLLVLANFAWIRIRWLQSWTGSHQKTLRVCRNS